MFPLNPTHRTAGNRRNRNEQAPSPQPSIGQRKVAHISAGNNRRTADRHATNQARTHPRTQSIPSSFISNLQQKQLDNFNTQVFLSGQNIEKEMTIIDEAAGQIMSWVSNTGMSKKDSYQELLKSIDAYDTSHPDTSSFAFRTALLAASHMDGVGFESWVVYTKPNRLQGDDKWTYLDNFKNWIPEVQGIFAKYTETAFVKAKALADQYSDQQVVLLKGGFGAGKTRLAKKLFEETSPGITAPDKGKEVVRRSMPAIPHAAAHVQGSQIAFRLFDDFIQQLQGTVAYDSSLRDPKDLISYMDKAEAAGKSITVNDVARYDMARILSVLARNVEGEDPRIPPSFIVHSAIGDKLRRHECMNAVLQSSSGARHSYDYYSADEQGWNTKKILTVTAGEITFHTSNEQEAHDLLALEGISYDADENKFILMQNKKELEAFFNEQLSKPVSEIMNTLSPQNQTELSTIFEGRKIKVNSFPRDPLNIYDCLDPHTHSCISKEAFNSIIDKEPLNSQAELLSLFQTAANTGVPLTYMELPLKTALLIHASLSKSLDKTSA